MVSEGKGKVKDDLESSLCNQEKDSAILRKKVELFKGEMMCLVWGVINLRY